MMKLIRSSCNYYLTLISLILSCFLFVRKCRAATYYVPGNYSSIQSAYNNVSAGDTIIVRPGTYPGGLSLNKSGSQNAPITIKAEVSWKENLSRKSVLDGNNSSSSIIYISGSYHLIDGFEITNSAHDGINVYGSHNQIVNNYIHHNGSGNSSYTYGQDGIYSESNVEGNLYDSNLISHNGRISGGCRSTIGGSGRCNLDHGLYLCGNNETVANNIVIENSAYGVHIAGYARSGTDGVHNLGVYHNVIAKNGRSGMMLWLNVFGANVRNNIFYENTEHGISSYELSGSGINVDHNLFYGNRSGPTDGNPLYHYDSQLNLETNPIFLAPPNDFHLQTNSPAIDAGIAINQITHDFDGNPRTGTAFDIGAYEFLQGSPTASPTLTVTTPSPGNGDVNRDGKVDISDLVIVGSNFGKKTSQGDANGDGLVNISDLVIVGSNFGRTAGPSPTTRPSATPTSPPGDPTPTPGEETFFPFGFMGVFSSAFGEVAATGSNLVHTFVKQEYSSNAKAYLDDANSHGFKVILELPYDTAEGWCNYIQALETHPALYAWFMPDEYTHSHGEQEAREYATRIRNCNRPSYYKPIFFNPGTTDGGAVIRYTDFTDVMTVANYPDLYEDGHRAIVTRGTLMDKRACLFSGAKGCDWVSIAGVFTPTDWGGSLPCPTADKIKNDIYQGIIAGSKMIWIYVWGGDDCAPSRASDITRIANEFLGPEKLGQVVLAPDISQSISVEITSGPSQSPSIDTFENDGQPTWIKYPAIQFLQKRYQGRTYLLAANVAEGTVTARFSGLPAGSTGKVLFEGRNVSTDGNDRFTDIFREYQVHVYRF